MPDRSTAPRRRPKWHESFWKIPRKSRGKTRIFSIAAHAIPAKRMISALYQHVTRTMCSSSFAACRTHKRALIKPSGGRAGEASRSRFSTRPHLGSAYVLVEFSEENQNRTLLFTADVGRYDTPIIPRSAADSCPVDSGHSPRALTATNLTAQSALSRPARCCKPCRCASPSAAGCSCRRLRWAARQTILWYIQKLISEKEDSAHTALR